MKYYVFRTNEADERPVYEYLEFGCGYERGIHQNVNKPRLSTQQRKHDFGETYRNRFFPRRTVLDLFNNESNNKGFE
jgi:hypothetical protein